MVDKQDQLQAELKVKDARIQELEHLLKSSNKERDLLKAQISKIENKKTIVFDAQLSDAKGKSNGETKTTKKDVKNSTSTPQGSKRNILKPIPQHVASPLKDTTNHQTSKGMTSSRYA